MEEQRNRKGERRNKETDGEKGQHGQRFAGTGVCGSFRKQVAWDGSRREWEEDGRRAVSNGTPI